MKNPLPQDVALSVACRLGRGRAASSMPAQRQTSLQEQVDLKAALGKGARPVGEAKGIEQAGDAEIRLEVRHERKYRSHSEHPRRMGGAAMGCVGIAP